ncbi:hypothetical protein HYH03_003399 [Edaphochlamys debaryana]|uniref:SRPBCC domain-containing protein n=1 Tax=Edaphochlamys debaryana TaxID=47281 RepID=A0A835YCB3_9CHLO|nr:hypothetical protein HYH03_003399 [Edaphochlamys debaryana]|eukprot:KAG2498653.1 hypothetical protein HYH03_003399 [Edaphochlamys debaryana]
MSLRTQIEINAPSERVWEVLSNYPGWSAWNSFLNMDQQPAGKLEPGQALAVAFQPPGQSKPTKMKPQVLRYTDGSELAWRGRLLGTDLLFVGEHFFRLEAQGPKKTVLHHGEDFRGLLVPLVGGMLKNTEKGFLAFNEGLKKAAEEGR